MSTAHDPNTAATAPVPTSNGAGNGSAPSEDGHGAPETEQPIGRLNRVAEALPDEYLQIVRHSVPFYLRIASLELDGVPDVVVDTGEGVGVPYSPPGSPERQVVDETLADAFAYGRETRGSAGFSVGSAEADGPVDK